MKALRLAIAVCAAFATALLASPAGSQSSSPIAVSSVSANAGNAEIFTISRVTGTARLRLFVVTGDETAKAGTDYTSVRQFVTLPRGQSSVTISVPTAVNPNALRLTFTLRATAYGAGVNGVGTIVEPSHGCPDGSTLPMAQACPVPVPVPTAAWVPAPLHDGGFARVTVAADPDWDMTGPGKGRPLAVGEVVAVYFNGWGNDADGQNSYAVYALNDGSAGRVKAAHIEGVAPSGNPPLPPPNLGLPADWWIPGLVTANKTCTNAYNPAQPGVTQGGVYRAVMTAGSHTALANGQNGSAQSVWTVFASDDPWQGARTVVTGDCLTGTV